MAGPESSEPPIISVGMSSRERGEKRDDQGRIVYNDRLQIQYRPMAYEERNRLPLRIYVDGEEKSLVEFEIIEHGELCLIDEIQAVGENGSDQLDKLALSALAEVLVSYNKNLKTLSYDGQDTNLEILQRRKAVLAAEDLARLSEADGQILSQVA